MAAGCGRTATDVLLGALAAHDPSLHEHVREVAELAHAVAWLLALGDEDREVVGRAGELHDIGKLAIPEEILTTRGPLGPDEEDHMRRHTLIGESIVAATPALGPVAALVRASHERWDGSGYPDGLRGEAIPLGARILAVCDAFSAMRAARPYGAVRSEAEAMFELRRCAGTQFDPGVVRAFCAARRAAPVTA
ncbi:MAG: HD domain-containing protein [Actinomycetota bacterium]|nr:HD domain-containing protein [Actinomycetota bacterium]